jgi:membrane protein DedA with SNARE-associated domain
VGTFAFSVLSGVVPFINVEVYLLYVGSIASRADIAPLVVAAVLGQMCAKSLLYLGGRGVLRIPSRRQQNARIEAVRARLAGGRWTAGGLTFVSALFGFPPFYGLSVVAGMLGWPFARFALCGAAGRVLRFSAVLLLPMLLKGGMS